MFPATWEPVPTTTLVSNDVFISRTLGCRILVDPGNCWILRLSGSRRLSDSPDYGIQNGRSPSCTSGGIFFIVLDLSLSSLRF